MAYRQEAALSAANSFTQHDSFKKSKHIACYLAFKDEFDCSPIIEAIWQAKKQCYLPVLTGKDDNTLHFVRYRYGDALHLNRFSILEPVAISHVIAPENLDIVVMPLLAFDLQGHRLGTGGGFYDRTFAFLHASQARYPHMLGLAYAAQAAEFIPSDPWDVGLDGVVTEKELIMF